jgi:hypothetical protein
MSTVRVFVKSRSSRSGRFVDEAKKTRIGSTRWCFHEGFSKRNG